MTEGEAAPETTTTTTTTVPAHSEGTGLTPQDVAALADAVASGKARLDGSTAVPAGCRASGLPSVEDVRGIIARTPAGVRF